MSNTIIEVKADSDTELYFRKQGDNTWLQLTPTSSGAPTISEVSEKSVTYEFVKYGSSTYDVVYKATGNSLPTSNGPTLPVASGDTEEAQFAKKDPNLSYYQGYVAVSEDSF